MDVDISADGTRVLITNDTLVEVWEPGSGEAPVAHESWKGSVSALTADGSLAASPTADDQKTIEIWSPDGATTTRLEGHSGVIQALDFSADGSMLASGAGTGSLEADWMDPVVRIWDVRTGEQLMELGDHGPGLSEVVFNSEGTRLATLAQDGIVRVWDVTTGELLQSRSPDIYIVHDLEFIGETETLALFRDSDIATWDYEAGAESSIVSFESSSYIPAGDVLMSGRYFVGMGEEYSINIWDTESGDIAATLPTGSFSGVMDFAEDDMSLALTGGAAWILDLSFLEDPHKGACDQVRRE